MPEIPQTPYVVLRRTSKAKSSVDAAATTSGNGNEQWERIATVAAASADAAIRKAALKSADPGNVPGSPILVAVPARSWKPVTVKAEQTITLKLENAPT